jgi:hypothetical protein
MIAIFNNEKEAVIFADTIHKWLTKYRKDYKAQLWCVPDKSDKEDLWYVKLPPDYEELNFKEVKVVEERLTVPLTVSSLVMKLPVDWKTIEEEVVEPKGFFA